MPQICPSPSRQLAAVAPAFRHARLKFPKNLGASVCSVDTARIPLQIYPMMVKNAVPDTKNILLESKPDYNPTTDHSLCSNLRDRKNSVLYPSLSSSRTAPWSNDFCCNRRGQIRNGLSDIQGQKITCRVCSTQHSYGQATESRVYDLPKQEMRVGDVADGSKSLSPVSMRVCRKIKATKSKESNQSYVKTTSKSAHNSASLKKRKHGRHRVSCIHVGRIWRSGGNSSPKIQGTSQFCHLYGHHAGTQKHSSMSRKPQTMKCNNGQALSIGNRWPREVPRKIFCNDSPIVADFPIKLQTWEHQTLQGYSAGENNMVSRKGMMLSRKVSDHQRTWSKDQRLHLTRNQATIDKPQFHQIKSSELSNVRKSNELDTCADVCLRPSMIKVVQRKVKLDIQAGKTYQNYGNASNYLKQLETKLARDENLNIINHKDSMSILKDRFKGSNKHHSLNLQNIYKLNSVLKSKTSGCENEPPQLQEIHQVNNHSATDQSVLQPLNDAESIETHCPPRKTSSNINPVTKLGRVANQALRESKSRSETIRSRSNRFGTCCSPKESPWGRVL